MPTEGVEVSLLEGPDQRLIPLLVVDEEDKVSGD